MRSAIKYGTLAVVFILIGWLSFEISSDSVQQNNEGIELLSKENSQSMSYKKFVSALASDPFNPIIQMNLGLSFFLNKEFDKALQAFTASLRLSPDLSEIKFYALFNSGAAEGMDKKIDLALEYYQKALEIHPDSIEVKTNMELLMQNQGQGKGKGSEQDSQDKNKDSSDQGKGKSPNPNEDKKNQKQDNSQNRNENQKIQNGDGKKPKLSDETLSPEQVKAILDELKNQEQKIRAQENEQGKKETPNGKDW